MTGTGTQTDPYIIESFEDFLNISGGENSYYKLGVNIDANIIKTKKVFRNLGSKVGLKRDFIGCVCGLEWDNWKLF